MNILLAVDGSGYSVRAVDFLAANRDWFQSGARLHVLNVHLRLPTRTAASFLGSEAVNQYYEEECTAALQVASAPLRERSIVHETAWRVGTNVAEEIRQYAEEHAIDLIVMGTHGHSALAGLVLGSTTTRVLALVKQPVLLVR